MKQLKKIAIKGFDFYLKSAIIIDIMVLIAIIFLQNRYGLFKMPSKDDDWVQSTFSSLISTSISLAGFILASLTIVVTFKSSIKAKLTDNELEKLNGLELILSSKHYTKIINLFKQVLYELVFVFVLLSYLWIFQLDFQKSAIFYCLVYGTLAISLGLVRTILVLFKILMLDK